MAQFQRLCMGCMKPIHESVVICPYCGYNSQSIQHAPYLPKQTVLAGRYLTGKVDNLWADSTVYMGFDLQTQKPIHIHEFLPEKIIIRTEGSTAIQVKIGYEQFYNTCLESFNHLWSKLMRLEKDAAIESVLDIFYENFTCYAISEFSDSVTLDEYFKKNEEILSWDKARSAFSPILSVLAQLHSMGIIHGEISPDTITVGSDGKLRLSGFTIAQTHLSTPEFYSYRKNGYAPAEAYDKTLTISPSSDVYSIAAVIYKAITGITPPTASRRLLNDTMVIPHEIAEKLPTNAINALVSAMKIYPNERISDISAFYAQINADKNIPQINTETSRVQENQKEKAKNANDTKESSPFSLVCKTFACVICVCIIVFCMLYTTFLYKNVNIPFLNTVFSPFSFLPMNKNNGNSNPSDILLPTNNDNQTSAAQVKMKDFVGLNYNDIKRDAVYNNDFKFEFSFESSDTIEKDKIISQSIPKGSLVSRGTTVTLVVSLGKYKIVLKDVVGQSYMIAYATLYNDGFVVLRKTVPNDGTHPSGVVSDMSLVAGLEFERGTQITLSVWE